MIGSGQPRGGLPLMPPLGYREATRPEWLPGPPFPRQRGTSTTMSASKGEVAYRLVLLHDLTYAVELKLGSGAETVSRGFADEAAAEAWIAERQCAAPRGEVWVRRPNLRWR